MNLHKLHRFSAVLIASYACIHIINHLVGLVGVDAHIAFMKTARLVYRSPVIEGLLLFAIALQIISGFTFVVRGWKQRQGFISWLQAISGAYLVFFLFNHVSAVLIGRNVLHLDTNFYYAAVGLDVFPVKFFFVPYYFLSVLALLTHLGCALYWQLPSSSSKIRGLAVALLLGIGFVTSLLILLTFTGVFYSVHVPLEYKAMYENIKTLL